MAGEESGPAELDRQAAASERLEPARRRPWLGMLCAVLLVMAAGAWWVHAEDPFNPYRDGTTHPATLVHDPNCPGNWGVSIDQDHYTWTAYGAPEGWLPGPVEGKVHILRQRSSGTSADSAATAVFEARGSTIDLHGGRKPYLSDLTCAIQ